jgi:hypothetical protein
MMWGYTAMMDEEKKDYLSLRFLLKKACKLLTHPS